MRAQICPHCNAEYYIGEDNTHNLARHEYACRNLHVIVSTTDCPLCGATNVHSVRILRNKTRTTNDDIIRALKKAKSADDYDIILKNFAESETASFWTKPNSNKFLFILDIITDALLLVAVLFTLISHLI